MFGILCKLLARGLRDMALHPWAQLLTLAAVTLVTFLSGLFLLSFSNFDRELNVTRGEVVYQVFWKRDTPTELVHSRWEEMRNLPWLTEMQTYTPQQALEALLRGTRSGGKSIDKHSSWLTKQNPLPPTAMLRFTPQETNMEHWNTETRTYLEALPGVESVRSNPLKDELARAWNAFASVVMWPVIAFLGGILALVVGNTIKLSLINRQDEIAILQLVGARNWFIRLPLLVSGMIQGALGGACGLGLVWLAWYHLRDVLAFPPLFVHLRFLPPEQALLLVVVPAMVAVASSWVAVRH